MQDAAMSAIPLENTFPQLPPKKVYLLLHCKDGCVPYLNPGQLEKHFPPSSGLLLGLAVQDACVTPLFNKNGTTNDAEAVATTREDADDTNHSKKVRGYTFSCSPPDPWLLAYSRVTVPSFFSDDGMQQNVLHTTSKNSNSNKAIFVWTPHGRQKLTVDTYAKVAFHGLQSQNTLSMCDVPEEESGKTNAARLAKACSRNSNWYEKLQAVLEKEHARGVGPSMHIWKSILLPSDEINRHIINENENPKTHTRRLSYNEKQRLMSTENVKGVAFVGQWQPGLFFPSALNSSNAAWQDMIEELNSNHNLEWRAILSTRSLMNVVEIAAEGYINIIGTNLPALWAKDKLAFVLHLSTEFNTRSHDEYVAKRPKIEEGSNGICTPSLDSNGCLDMSHKCHSRDAMPLVVGCDCMTCNHGRFSRAYIRHLVCANGELLAEVLLFAHNLHHLMQLIEKFNIPGNDPEQLKKYVASQLPKQVSTP
jgi:hypothetical protein